MNFSNTLIVVFLTFIFPAVVIAADCKDTELYTAVDQTDLAKVTQLLASGSNVNERSCYGRSPIMATTWWSFPTREDNLKILDLLISKGADINNQDIYGDTTLILAARTGYSQVIHKLIHNHADVNLLNRKGNSVLIEMLAEDVVSIDMELFNYILTQNLDLNIKNAEGVTALTELLTNQYVVKNDKNILFVIRSLLQKGADQNLIIQSGNYKPCVDNSYNALMIASCFGYQEIVQTLLQFNSQVNAINAYGQTALTFAVAHNNEPIVALLLQAKAQVNLPGTTPVIVHAVKNGNPTLVKMLLDVGANTFLPDQTPILSLCVDSSLSSYAKEENYLLVADILMKHGLNVNAVDDYNETALYKATHQGLLNFMNLFLQNGASVKIADKTGRTPIQIARDIDSLKLLLQFGADINEKDNEGNTFLHSISSNGEFADKLAWIIQQGAKIDAKNNKGYTPVRVALENVWHAENFDLAHNFFSLGADKNSIDNEGVSHLASLVNKIYGFKLAKDSKAVQFAIWLIQQNVDLNTIQTKNGYSILHYAIWIYNDENVLLAELLKSQRLNLNIINKNGENALLSVLNTNVVKKQAEIDTIIKVIAAGIDLNLQNSDGNTALMLIFKFGRNDYNEITKLIVNRGANLNLRNKLGKTALGFAIQFGLSTETIKLLVDHGAVE